MNIIQKRVSQNAAALIAGEKRFEDLYRIIFSTEELVMSEEAAMTRMVTKTYGEAKQDIEHVAKAIAAETGLTDCYIGLHADNRPEWIILFWAILRSGNKPYLINLRHPHASVANALNALDALCVIACGDAKPFDIPILSYQELLAKGKSIEETLSVPFGDTFALSSGGTSLKEKICIYHGAQISAQILNMNSIIQRNPDIIRGNNGQIKMLAFLPLYHIFGLEAMYLWFTFFGTTFVFLHDLAPETILRTARDHEVTHVFAVPLLWHAIEKALNREIAKKTEKEQKKFHRAVALSIKLQNTFPTLGKWIASRLFSKVRTNLLGDRIRFCISGGSSIRQSTLTLLNALGYPLYNGYGMTEIGIASVELGKTPKARIRGSIGMPFDSVCYRIGAENRLLVKGSSLCAEMIVDGVYTTTPEWFDTADVVHADETGSYYIDGRLSDVVFGDDGENLNPNFAEQAFVLRDALQLAVTGNEDNTKLMLVVRIPRGMLAMQKKLMQEEIAACNATLPPSYQVRVVKYTFDALMGQTDIKVSRAYLKKAIAENEIRLFDLEDADARQCADDASEIRTVLRRLFAEALGVSEDEVTPDAHFMNDLGGTSLDYFSLISAVGEHFGITLDFESSGFHYTLNDFEQMIKDLINQA